MKINQNGFGAVGVIFVLIIVGVIVAAGWTVYQKQNRDKKYDSAKASITNFEECKAAGYSIGESYPEQCFADGQTFVNDQQNTIRKIRSNRYLTRSKNYHLQ